MKLPVPFIQLPLLFDAAALSAEIEALGEDAWRPHPQGFAGNSMLPLVAVHGDPDNESFVGAMAPTTYLRRCPYLMQVLASLGATVGRSRLMRLAGQAEVTRHADQGYYWAERVRVHVPVVTQPTVRFECGGAAINMAAGECWIFDTWRQHRVLNDAEQSRIHLVADTVGGGEFWQLIAAGRAHDGPREGWRPRRVEPAPGAAPEVECEQVNIPAVMSPWELKAHIGGLLEDALPHPQLPAVRQRSVSFMHQWRGLWFRHGESEAGRGAYRKAVADFVREVEPLARELPLRNELGLSEALLHILTFAVPDPKDSRPRSAEELRRLGDYA
jgi:hypothetical protein